MVPGLLLLCCLSAAPGAGATPQEPWTLELGPVRRTFAPAANGGWTTTALAHGDRILPVTAREFQVTLADGRVLTPDRARAVTWSELAEDSGRQGQAVTYAFEVLQVVVEYFTSEDLPLACKQLRLVATEEGSALPGVATWEVERWSGTDVVREGGPGLPGLLDGFWSGLADPAGMNTTEHGGTAREALRLHHGPRRLGDRSAIAVTAPIPEEGPALEELRRLLAADLPRQRVVLHHREPEGTTNEELRRLLGRLLRHLSRGQGGRLDALVLDQGWWAAGADHGDLAVDPVLLPDDGGPLIHALRDAGAGLGLGIPVLGDLSEDGERARLLRAVLGRMGRMRPTYLDHAVHAEGWSDGERGWDHLDTLFQAERRLRADVFLSAHPALDSPWWLRALDGMRLDTAAAPTPTGDAVWAWRTGEDALLWERSALGYPVERLTTSQPMPAQATDRQRVEQFLWATARGSRELALPPDPEQWSTELGRDLSQVVRWSHDRQELLDLPAETVGGPPGSGRVYGYLHQSGERALLVLRNPGLDPVPWTLPALASPWLVTFPWCELRADGAVTLPGESLLCLETLAAIQDLEDVPSTGRFLPGERGPRQSTVDLLLRPGEERRFRWWGAPQQEPEARVGLALGPGRRPAAGDAALARLTTAVEEDRLCATISGMGAWFGERWQVLVRYRGDPGDLAPQDLAAETRAREERRLADGWLWILTPATRQGPWTMDLPLGTGDGLWELRARRTEQREVARIARAHAFRALGTPVLPPATWAREQVQEHLLGRVAPLQPTPSALDVPR